jgi:hypothetical protein
MVLLNHHLPPERFFRPFYYPSPHGTEQAGEVSLIYRQRYFIFPARRKIPPARPGFENNLPLSLRASVFFPKNLSCRQSDLLPPVKQ